MDEIYMDLAKRNGWTFSMIDDRPYFMENGNYAIPNDETTREDKDLLAEIIAEGSTELKRIILMCWDNGIIISGPCSGIRETHNKRPTVLHLGIIASPQIVTPLYTTLSEEFPNMNHLCAYREKDNNIRYDMLLSLVDIDLSKEQSDEIFGKVANELQTIIEKDKRK